MPNCWSHLAAVFGPDARHAGDVVHRVADERLEVDDLVRAHAPVRLDPGRVEQLAFGLAQVQDLDLLRDELAAVLVGGAEEDVEPARGGLRRRPSP